MTRSAVRSGLRAGAVFSVILIFLALIGFTVTGAGLIAKFLGDRPGITEMPGLVYFATLLALIGLWNGSYAARPQPPGDSRRSALVSGLVAGLLVGLVSAVLVFIFGSLLSNNVDPRKYLAMVSPDAMRLYLFNLPAGAAAFLHLLLFAVSGAAGGLLAHGLRHVKFSDVIRDRSSKLSSDIQNTSAARFVRSTPWVIYVIYALIAVALFFLPRVWGSYWNYIIGTVGIYVILGLGLNIIVGLAGQLVLGYVAFFAIGAYTVALLTAPQPHALQWNFWLVVIIGIVLSALTGILLGLPILRLRGDYLAIVTLGFGEIIRIMLRSDLLTSFTAGPKGVRDIAGPTLFGQSIANDINFMYLIILAVILIIFITSRLQNSRAGRAWVAIREDEIAARAVGINTFQSKLLALAIGAAFAGLGGVLFASRNQFTGPEDHSLMVSINVLALVIVGGMGSIPGIILGAFALKGLPEMLRELENYRLLAFGGLLVVMMILRPEGLWPGSRPNLEDFKGKETLPESPPAQQASADSTTRVEGA